MYASRAQVASDSGTKATSRTLSPEAIEWTLRVGAFLCFVGHGAFGIMTKRAWLPYFAVANIGPETAYRLMPLVGALDITMGFLALLVPRPAVIYWMTLWAIWTALLRPLSGESGWEALERAGNYGVPMAMIAMFGPWRGLSGFFGAAEFRSPTPELLQRLKRFLIIVVVMLLVGHGALGLEAKKGLIANYASVMPGDLAARATPMLGAFEIALAVALAGWPSVGLALFIAVWKLATESLFVAAGQPFWEIVERGGSYTAPIALAIVLMLAARRPNRSRTHVVHAAG
jgi:hypothetical protein